jgi:hypothetical protein
MKKQQVILIVLTVALAGYLFFKKDNNTHYTLPDIKKIEKNSCFKLTVKSKDKKIILERKNDSWYIKPENFKADNSLVDKMLNTVCNLEITDLASQSKTYSKYKLDDKNGIFVKLEGKEKSLREFTIGKVASSYSHTFVKLQGDDNIYYAKGNFRRDYDLTKDELRDKTVLSFDEEILTVSLTDKGKTLEIVRNGFDNKKGEKIKNTSKWVDKEGNVIDNQDIESLINTLKTLKCDSFVRKGEEKSISQPVYTVRLKGSKTYELQILKKQKEKFLATSSETKYQFYLPKWKVEQIMLDLKKIKDKK